MILDGLLSLLLAVAPASAADPSAADPAAAGPLAVGPSAAGPPDAPEGSVEEQVLDAEALAPWRTRFDLLSERTLGTASRPVEFDWRRSTVQIAASGGYLAELNSFNSMRGGALVRVPTGGSLVEIGLSRVETWDSPSSEVLAFTPYRQPGRPARFELDVGMAIPLAEGIVTAVPRFFPAVQMVFHAYAGARYLIYPQGFGEMRPGQIAGALLSPSLTDHEIARLEDARLGAMQVDRGRFGLVAGLGNDIYFKSGFFVAPRVILAVPLLAPMAQTDLVLWADFSLAVGLAL